MFKKYSIWILPVLLFYFLLVNFFQFTDQQYSLLARSFLEGKLFFIDVLGGHIIYDSVTYGGHYYWPLGPFPSILLMIPVFLFEKINLFFYQGYLNFLLSGVIFWLVYIISKKIGFTGRARVWLGFTFIAASSVLGTSLISSSWYIAHTVTLVLILLALYEYYSTRRYYLIGIYFGLVAMTRLTAGLGIIFFILTILFLEKTNLSIKAKKLFQLSLPFIISLGLLMLYNNMRFNDLFEQGYSSQIISGILANNRDFGLLNLIHLPGNLYYLFLSGPLPVFLNSDVKILKFPFIAMNPWGMSILLTSPYLAYLFFHRYKDRLAILLWITILVIAIPLLLYYGIGYNQFGYRYALDFWPFLFLLFMLTYKQNNSELSLRIKILFLVSAFFNLYLTLIAYVQR